MMARATNTGILKRKEERKKALPVLQMLLSREEWRQVAQAALHWFEAHKPMGQMVCKSMPRQIFQKLSLHGTQIRQKAETTYTNIKRL
jgi:hypothetical protein